MSRWCWYVELLLPRMAGRPRWEWSSPLDSWTVARRVASTYEREGYQARVVFVTERGEVFR